MTRIIETPDLKLTDALRQMSTAEFQTLGAGEIAYIRPVNMLDRRGYALYGADGTPISVQDTETAAALAARSADMHAVLTH